MITDDILAPYRKTPLASPPKLTTPPGKGEYAAYAIKENTAFLRIRRKNFLTYAVGYNILLINTYDDDKGGVILLYYSVMKVKIEGRNLQSLVHALNHRKADYVLEFDPDRWAMPTDPKAPFIESIEVAIDHGDGVLKESKP